MWVNYPFNFNYIVPSALQSVAVIYIKNADE